MNSENIIEYLQLKNKNIDNETEVKVTNLVKMLLDLENKDWGNEETLKFFVIDSISLIKDITNNIYKSGYVLGSDEGYNKGYNVGYDDGYNDGHEDGYEVGYDEGRCHEKNENEKENHA